MAKFRTRYNDLYQQWWASIYEEPVYRKAVWFVLHTQTAHPLVYFTTPTSRIHYLNLSNSEYDRWSDPIKGDDSPRSNYDSGTYEWL